MYLLSVQALINSIFTIYACLMLHVFCFWASIYRIAFHFPDFDDLAAGLYAAASTVFFVVVVVVNGVLKGCFGCGNSRDYVLTLIG